MVTVCHDLQHNYSFDCKVKLHANFAVVKLAIPCKRNLVAP